MKTFLRPSFGPPVLALLVGAGCASPGSNGGGSVSLKWEEPERFTDFAAPASSGALALAQEQRRLEHELIDLADAYIPEGCNVRITFRDLDRAGRIDPLAPRPIRVVSDHFPVRAEFDYVVTNPAGEPLRHGQETLRLAFPQYLRSGLDPDSPMPDLRELFQPWFRQLGRQLPRSGNG